MTERATESTPTADCPDSAARIRSAQAALATAARGPVAYHANACVRCGLCGDSCHIYRAEPEPANLPAAKADEVARFFRRYHTRTGRIAPWLVGARELTTDSLAELVDSVFGRCTGCGRCGLHCSIGLDIASVIRVGREMLAAAGLEPDGLRRTVNNQLEHGNQMAIPRDELIATAEWLAEDLRTETGRADVTIPVDQPGRRVLYLINPREVKFFPLSLSAMAGVFAAAGESWTLSSRFYDVTNYALFSSDAGVAGELTRRVMAEAEALQVQEVILGECGHGFRAFRWEGPNWLRRPYPVAVRSVLEVMDEYLARGRIRVDASRNPQRVTLHDPCNLVRWGGVSEPQRRVLRRCCADFVEMTPNRQDNYCCGGGGGMLAMSEYGQRRIASGRLKAEQVRASGAKTVATPCHNCADQFLELNKHYKLGIEVSAVSELVYAALLWS